MGDNHFSKRAFRRGKKWYSIIASGVRGSPIFVFPIIILTTLCLTAVFASLIAPYSSREGNLAEQFMPPGSRAHLLGTDHLGRDILSRLIFGTRVTLTVGLLSVFFAGIIGTIIGMISGYFTGNYIGYYIDSFLMRVTDIGLSMPMILVALVLACAFGPSYANVIVIITLLLWPRYARQIRGETLNIMQREFVTLAKVASCSTFRVIRHHVFPNVTPTLLVLSTLQVGYIIVMEATLSFLGVGIPPPTPSWGVMVAEGREFVFRGWWICFFPGLSILCTVLSLNLLGDWLRDRLDPKLKQI